MERPDGRGSDARAPRRGDDPPGCPVLRATFRSGARRAATALRAARDGRTAGVAAAGVDAVDAVAARSGGLLIRGRRLLGGRLVDRRVRPGRARGGLGRCPSDAEEQDEGGEARSCSVRHGALLRSRRIGQVRGAVQQ
ncbi:hypothetical protein ACU4GR_16305 [Methylobacterium oryzae CBMB20]